MSRQPVPGEVWTDKRYKWPVVCAIPGYPEHGVFVNPIGDPFVIRLGNLTPPPELPPADVVASVTQHWINVYDGGGWDGGGWTVNLSSDEANRYASSGRIWLVHPDGRWQKCNGKEVIGEPVEVPR